ncbi:hypothetical protein BCR33DRAFT_724533 [Rhizoclosmatium globosum]|uniref:Uncharacterized protein n=1 Tax=Rhizoclosmatium globosum TaxID=329046 RepID=A0A1Y2B505_9FUNG|nr:hypothetical protein BCR33DRAFT_724533 [Rhizoclosmatium globosum]|eukprot:ORY29903.1 hypothetical protein BCR33DRAFT_724533 [Rhizoclosmatium globosum]
MADASMSPMPSFPATLITSHSLFSQTPSVLPLPIKNEPPVELVPIHKSEFTPPNIPTQSEASCISSLPSQTTEKPAPPTIPSTSPAPIIPLTETTKISTTATTPTSEMDIDSDDDSIPAPPPSLLERAAAKSLFHGSTVVVIGNT